ACSVSDSPRAPRDLAPFPTRRSSDLTEAPVRCPGGGHGRPGERRQEPELGRTQRRDDYPAEKRAGGGADDRPGGQAVQYARHRRSEEHTSELQSRFDLVCRLLLEKKK